jgi:hypothetical protein
MDMNLISVGHWEICWINPANIAFIEQPEGAGGADTVYFTIHFAGGETKKLFYPDMEEGWNAHRRLIEKVKE